MSIELSVLPSAMPKMLSGENLVKVMSVLPDYDPSNNVRKVIFVIHSQRMYLLKKCVSYVPYKEQMIENM